MFKWHLVSNGVIIITIIIMITTVVVITGALAGVYQLFLSSCHFRQRFKVLEQKQQVTNTLHVSPTFICPILRGKPPKVSGHETAIQ